MDNKIIAPYEYDLKEDLFALSSLTHPYFSPEKISEIKKHYGNGLSRFTEKIKVEIVTDIKKCRKLWQKFSPQKSLFDTWNFRNAFHKHIHTNPYFLTVKKNSDYMAVLPLYYDKKEEFYGWFGSNWQEDNTFFAENPAFIPLLLYLAPKSLYIYAITEDAIKKVPDFFKFKKDDPKFILDISSLKSIDEFLASLKKKKRYNLKRDRKKIEKLSPKIILNNFSDYEKMVTLCKRRFSKKGELSDFDEDPNDIKIFKETIKQGKDIYTPKMMSVKIGESLAAVDLIAVYKDTYYPLHGGGYDIEKFPGVGNYITLLEISEAIKLGLKKMDFLQNNYGWKKSWFTKVPLYKYIYK